MSDEPWWIVLMTERFPKGDGPARLCVLGRIRDKWGWLYVKKDRLDEAHRFTREQADRKVAEGYPGYCLTAVPIGPGVPGLAWEGTR